MGKEKQPRMEARFWEISNNLSIKTKLIPDELRASSKTDFLSHSLSI